MNAYVIILLGWGTAGAALAQILQYCYLRQENLRFDLGRGVIITFASGLGVLAYFIFVDSKQATPLMILHFGLFLALTIEEISDISQLIKKKRAEKKDCETVTGSTQTGAATYAVASTSNDGAILVSGFLPIYGMTCLGALAAELSYLCKKQDKSQNIGKIDIAISALVILVSGVAIVISYNVYENRPAQTYFLLGTGTALAIRKGKYLIMELKKQLGL